MTSAGVYGVGDVLQRPDSGPPTLDNPCPKTAICELVVKVFVFALGSPTSEGDPPGHYCELHGAPRGLIFSRIRKVADLGIIMPKELGIQVIKVQKRVESGHSWLRTVLEMPQWVGIPLCASFVFWTEK